MSVYNLNKVLYLADNDEGFRRWLKDDPHLALAGFRLSEDEKVTLMAGEVARLREIGVHTFLLNHMARYELFGVNRENYLDRIRVGMPYDPRFEVSSMPVQHFIPRSLGSPGLERLRAWLKENGIEIVRPGLAGNGMVTLRLRRPSGSEFEIDFFPDELEANPENAIAQLKTIIGRR